MLSALKRNLVKFRFSSMLSLSCVVIARRCDNGRIPEVPSYRTLYLKLMPSSALLILSSAQFKQPISHPRPINIKPAHLTDHNLVHVDLSRLSSQSRRQFITLLCEPSVVDGFDHLWPGESRVENSLRKI